MKFFFITALTLMLNYSASASVTGDTLIGTPDGQIAIEQLIRGDLIISVAEGSAPYNIKPKNQKLMFSSADRIEQNVVYLNFGENQSLIMTLDQPVLTQSGVLKRAKDLVINDQLVDAKGNVVEIHYLALGRTNAMIVAIAPESNFVTENLFLANGIYLGSYKVEIRINDHYPIRAFLGQEF